MKRIFIFTAIVFALSGCAWLQPAPADSISKLAVIQVGDQPPQGDEYVVLFPAGKAFPVKFNATGSLLSPEKQIESYVTLAKDLYLYKYWASYDGKSWVPSHSLIGVDFGGGFDVTGLHASMKLEAK